MRLINRISLRTLTISLVGLLAILAVLAQVLVAQYFRGAAFTAQQQSLTQVVDVASAEVLRQLEAQLFLLGTEIQARSEFKNALARFQREGERDALQAVLQEPFAHGFAAVLDEHANSVGRRSQRQLQTFYRENPALLNGRVDENDA
jgi:hypothetical protein